MIGCVTIGTNDLPRAAAIYDALFGELGAKRSMDSDAFIAWTVGNAVMVALVVKNRAKVDALHRKALQLGGTDEGAPLGRGRARITANAFLVCSSRFGACMRAFQFSAARV